MGKKLYVGSLPYSTSEDELRDMFGACGAVDSVSIIIDKFSGKSKGFGFVEMSNDDEAQKAINDLNGREMGGRSIVVNEARPPEKRSGGFGGGGGRGRGGFGGGGGGRGRDRDGGGGRGRW